MKYTVTIDNDLLEEGLSKSNAIKAAKKAAIENPRSEILVQWFRRSDGQKGYLNPDGNHAITGKFWQVIKNDEEAYGPRVGQIVSFEKFQGTVTEVKDGLVHIAFDDGDEGWEKIEDCEFI